MSEIPDRQAHGTTPAPGVGARVGAAVDQLGGRLGALAAETGGQLRDLAARAGVATAEIVGTPGAEDPAPPSGSAPLARADAALDRTGERIGGVLAFLSWQARRAVARTREEVEDIWAEAQSVRRGA